MASLPVYCATAMYDNFEVMLVHDLCHLKALDRLGNCHLVYPKCCGD